MRGTFVKNTPEWKAIDRTESLVRSIQQSLKAEGYIVSAEVVREIIALSRKVPPKASMNNGM